MGRCVDADAGTDAGGERDAEPSDAAMLLVDADADDDAGDAGCTRATFYRDADGDGHGDPSDSLSACALPDGYASVGDDCDDDCASCIPGGTESCNGRNDDCDAEVDEGLTTTWYVDCDEDGYAPSVEGAVDACSAPPDGPASCASGGWTDVYPTATSGSGNRRDCADSNRDAHPMQAGYFATAIAGVPESVDYDYDCDGLELPRYAIAEEACASAGGTRCSGGSWSGGAVPACGDYGDYTPCVRTTGVCALGGLASRTRIQQLCR